MTLDEIREFLSKLFPEAKCHTSKLDTTREKTICIYPSKPSAPINSIGSCSTYDTKAITILVHWGKRSQEAENIANMVYDSLYHKSAVIGGKRVIKFEMLKATPQGVGTDGNGFYEHVIETVIYYDKRNGD